MLKPMKRRRSPIFEGFVLLALLACILLLRRYPSSVLIALGALAITTAIQVESRSKQIWKNYKRNYQPGRNKLINTLNEPREIYHFINVYLLWPAVFVLGILAIRYGLKLR
jgi:hypothetical protein